MERYIHKATLSEQITQDYGICFTPKCMESLSEKALIDFAKNFKLNTENSKRKITYQKQIIKATIIIDNIRINTAAFRIQKAWRKYVGKKIHHKEANIKLNNAALVVQRWVKGHLVRKKYSLILDRKKLERSMNKLEAISQKVYENSAQSIQQAWKSYIKKKKATRKMPVDIDNTGGMHISDAIMHKIGETESEAVDNKIQVILNASEVSIAHEKAYKVRYSQRLQMDTNRLSPCKCKSILQLVNILPKAGKKKKIKRITKKKSRFPDIQRNNSIHSRMINLEFKDEDIIWK